jgi:hypothetical protein
MDPRVEARSQRMRRREIISVSFDACGKPADAAKLERLQRGIDARADVFSPSAAATIATPRTPRTRGF